MRLGRWPLLVLASLLLTVPACERCRGAGSSGAAKPTSPTLAKVGAQIITAADFQARLAEEPAFALSRYKNAERRKELLDSLIRSELLLQEAHRRGLESDPEVRAALEKVLIHKLTRAYTDERNKANPISDAELRRYYDTHLSEFVVPTRVRVSHLFLAAPDKAPQRARALAEANRLLPQIAAKEVKGEKQAFERIASQKSQDSATKATGGDLGFRTKQELSAAWGEALAEAAFALKKQNELGPVVPTPKGIHLIKLLGRHEGYETSFESARSRLESALSTDRRTRALDDLVTALKAKTPVSIDEKALDALEVKPPPVASGDTKP